MDTGAGTSAAAEGFDVDGLPPGFRFHPTDEEIIVYYLMKKAADRRFTAIAIGEADLNKCEPWDLPRRSKMGEKEWFFFFQRDRKYPTGTRTNRATESGYWKATGKDKEIFKRRNFVVGMKKTLVFYKGRAPKGEKSDWVMHEYRLEGDIDCNISRIAKDEWVVCKVFNKNKGCGRSPRIDSFSVEALSTLPPLREYCESFENEYADSPRAFMGNHPIPMQNDRTNLILPQTPMIHWSNSHHSLPTHVFYSQNTLHGSTFPHQHISNPSYPTYESLFKSSFLAPKMEMVSTNNSMISHENATNETSSKEDFEQELNDITFSPNDISDLDSMWSY